MKSEKEIERYLVKKVKEAGGICVKMTCPGFAGMPDRMCVLPGDQVHFIEVKREDGHLSDIQKLRFKQLEELGQSVFTVYNAGQIDSFLNGYESLVKAGLIRAPKKAAKA